MFVCLIVSNLPLEMSHTKIHPVIHTFGLLVSEEKHWWRELSLITYNTSHMLTKIAYFNGWQLGKNEKEYS